MHLLVQICARSKAQQMSFLRCAARSSTPPLSLMNTQNPFLVRPSVCFTYRQARIDPLHLGRMAQSLKSPDLSSRLQRCQGRFTDLNDKFDRTVAVETLQCVRGMDVQNREIVSSTREIVKIMRSADGTDRSCKLLILPKSSLNLLVSNFERRATRAFPCPRCKFCP